MPKLKLLHVAPSIAKSYGGPTYSLWSYVSAALAAGCDVTVAAPDCDAEDATSALTGARLLTFPSHGRAAFKISPALWRWLRAEGAHYDVIHVHGLFNPVSAFSSCICRNRGWPLVIRPFGTLSRFTFTHRRALLKRVWYRLLERANVANAGAIHFTTVDEQANAVALGAPIGDRGHVVPPPWMRNGRGGDRHGGNIPTVLLIGRLHPVKSVESVLAAWRTVLRQLPAARLVIAGEGDPGYVATLRELASPLSESVSFAGFVTGAEKQRLLDEAMVFVLPSHHENFGIAVLEAIAHGLPVIISPEVQLATFVREHELGMVVPRDAEPLATALVTALNDTELQERCRTLGPGIVERHFSIESIGTRLLTMYDAARATVTA